MSENLPAPPPGFVLDTAPTTSSSAAVPPPPAGFTLDATSFAAPTAGAARNPFASSLPGWLGAMQDFNTALQSGAGQGVTANFGDELGAGFMTPIQMGVDAVQGKGFDPGASYNRALQGSRADLEREAMLNPAANTTGQVLGAGIAATAAAGNGITLLKNAAPTVGSMLPRLTAEGAAWGSLYGAGNGTDLEDRGSQAVEGALGGAATGAVLGGAVGPLAAKVGSGLSDSATMLRNALMYDLDRRANIAAAGPGAMVADAGPNTAGLLDLAIQRSGPGSTAARNAIEARAAEANDLIHDTLRQHLGDPAGVVTVTSNLKAQSAPAIRKAYADAYAASIDYRSPAGQRVNTTLRRVPPSVKNSAAELMRMEGVDPMIEAAPTRENLVINPDGSYSLPQQPSVQMLDYIKRALNDAADSTEGMGAMGGHNTRGRVLLSLAQDLRNAVSDAVPAYGTALGLASDPITARSAAVFGTKMLSPIMPLDQVQERIASMTPADVDALKQGVAGHIAETVANVRAVASDPNLDARQAQQALAMLSSDAVRAKLAAVPGLDAQHLTGQLDQAAKALQLRASVATGSRTFGRLAADEALNTSMNAGPINALRQGKPVNATQAVVQALMRSSPKAQQAYKAAVYGNIADALTAQRGAAAAAHADQLTTVVPRLSPLKQALLDILTAAGADQTERATNHLLRGR